MTLVSPPPSFSDLRFIYPWPRVREDYTLDERVWFAIPAGVDYQTMKLNYLAFPFGAEEEMAEVSVDALDALGINQWTG